MKSKGIHVEVWMGAVLILLSIIFYIMAGQFMNPSAAVWPKAVLIGIIILSVMLIAHGVRLTKEKNGTGGIPGSVLKGPMVSLAAIILYAVCMNFAGYFVSTAIFVPAGMLALGQRNWKVILGVTVGLEFFVYFLFVMQLQLRMP